MSVIPSIQINIPINTHARRYHPTIAVADGGAQANIVAYAPFAYERAEGAT